MALKQSYDEGEVPVRGESTELSGKSDSLPSDENEEFPGANEIVPQSDGVASRSGSSEVLDRGSSRILLGGGMLIGAILAARVKQVGQVQFYEGIPDPLPHVLRAGVELAPS